MFTGLRLLKIGLLVGASTAPLAAFAQATPSTAPAGPPDAAQTDAQPSSSDTIVITALRRDTELQSTPAAVIALSGEELASRGISTVEDLSAIIPSVSFGKNIGQAHIAIRGIGADSVVAGQDPRIAFYQDGVYIARPDAQVAGMFDVGSVQILKGPQGTLYGRNATGGAIVVTSAAPTEEAEGYLRLGYGNYNAVKVETAISGPVSSTVAMRGAIHYDRRDGYGNNVITGTDIDDRNEVGGRFSVLWTPFDGLEFLTIADYSRENDRANGLHYFGAARPGVTPLGITLGGTALYNSRDIASDIDPKVEITNWGIVEQITYDAGWATLSSVAAYRDVDSRNVTDVDGTSAQVAFDTLFNNSNQFSEELTITGDFDRLSWLVGGQYFFEDIGPSGAEIPINSVVAGGANSLRDAFFSQGLQKTQGFAGYGQISYELIDGLTFTVGGRYSTEKKKLHDTFQLDFSTPYVPGGDPRPVAGFPRNLSDKFSRFTPTATIQYQLNGDIFTYFTYGQGFKSGGYVFGVNQPAYRPEKITSYEGGVKSTWAGGAVTANLIGFHYDYTDLQVTQVRGSTSVTENAATAKVDGLEAELAVRPIDGLTLGGSIAYLDATYDQFTSIDPTNTAAGSQDLSGNRMTQAPELSYNLYAQNVWALESYDVTLRGDYNHMDDQFFTPFENPLVAQKAYGVGSVSLKFANHGGWSVEAYVRNIGDTKAIAQTYVSSTLFRIPVLGTLIAPRTYGVTLGYAF